MLCAAWIGVDDLDCVDDVPEGQEAELADIVEAAVVVLYVLSGQQFGGICESTERPIVHTRDVCLATPGNHRGAFGWRPTHQPVRSIEQVKVDGEVLDDDEYVLIDNAYIMRAKGLAWPCRQDITRASTEVGTWEVTYTHGVEPPAIGKTAARKLACELVKARYGLSGCQLPKSVQSITRQGVNQVMIDPFAFLNEGRVGVYEVDTFLMVANPDRISSNATVTIPGVDPTGVSWT